MEMLSSNLQLLMLITSLSHSPGQLMREDSTTGYVKLLPIIQTVYWLFTVLTWSLGRLNPKLLLLKKLEMLPSLLLYSVLYAYSLLLSTTE